MTLLLSAAEAAVLAPLQAVVFQEYVSRASISGASASGASFATASAAWVRHFQTR
jgi:hypothetical protein